MTVFRVNKDKENPYMMVNKFFIHDNRLSLKAKGLMSYFLSRPDDWEFYVSEIKKHTTDKETSISNAIKELIENGYIKRTSKREENGKFKGGYDYEVYETPVNIVSNETACTEYEPKLENPESGKSRTGEIPNWENQRLLNNDIKLNNDNTTNKSSSCCGNLEVFKTFERCGFGLLSPMLMEKIAADIEIYSAEWVKEAAEIADSQGKHTYAYVKGILENWKANGKNSSEFKKSKSRKSSNSKNKKDTFNNFEQRSYNFEELETDLIGWYLSEEN